MNGTMRRWGIAGALAGTLVLAGCATAGESDQVGAQSTMAADDAGAMEPTASASGEAGAESTEPAMDVAAPFDFTAPTVIGNGTFDGATIANKDVILWFWAPWCPTCLAEAPEIKAAIPRLPDGIEVIGMAGLSGDFEFMQEFARTADVEQMTHVADLDGSIWRGFGISAQATVVFIDESGESTQLGGGLTADDIVREAERLASA
ncbi:redoxin domain-containing protein [Demequina sp.]|uniref:redoxin domain-containing protein n=1 Tax=Demequina sp. TaxID=2050685 RepID=UPI0026000CD0|nr:redoxin domain-containing protein [Demequina sp.]